MRPGCRRPSGGPQRSSQRQVRTTARRLLRRWRPTRSHGFPLLRGRASDVRKAIAIVTDRVPRSTPARPASPNPPLLCNRLGGEEEVDKALVSTTEAAVGLLDRPDSTLLIVILAACVVGLLAL